MIDYSIPVSDVDINLYNLLWYSLTMSVLTVNTYQLLKPLFKKKLKIIDLEFAQGPDQYDRMVEREVDFIHLLIPTGIGFLVGFSFPITYFDLMPFQSYWVGLDRFYTGIIFGGISNGAYTNYNMIKELGLSLVGRIIGIKRY